MEDFIKYLQSVKKVLENPQSYQHIHIVIGNESCDVDSSISATVLAYFLHIHRSPMISNDAIVVPVQNVSKENFLYRVDNCYLYKEIDTPLDLLVYWNEIDLEELMQSKKVTTTLVDHHVLTENHKLLKDTVVQIFDHRPKDPEFNWKENEVELIIDEVGSCSTLIAEKILSINEKFLFKELGYLIYATIIFDTQALSPESKRAKPLDHQVVATLEKNFSFTDSRNTVYEKIWKAHNDVSQLTPKQILVKDLKVVELVPVPGLPMLVADFLNLKGAYEAIRQFAVEHNASLVVLIGLDASNGVKRDIAIFSNFDGDRIRDRLLDMLCNCQQSKGYDFRFKEIEISFDGIKCFRQENITLSRKQLIPIIIDAVKLSACM